MTDNVTVSNSPSSINTDIPVRTVDKAGEQVKVVAIDYGGAGTEDLTVPDFATETTLTAVKNELASGINVNNIINADILGVGVTGRRNNEIEISFFDSFNTDVITTATTSGGTATISGGHALFQTGTNTNGSSRATTVYQCAYRPAHEEYAYFTASFTTGIANSYQRIGIYDTNNGFYIGWEGTSFGISLRTGAANTFVARASWNGDLLDGNSGSIFTRDGIPEAINLAYSNLFRIRFAWLGSAPIVYEVFSPDGKWILFHTLRIPNSQLLPSIQTPNLGMKLECVKSGGGATNLTMTSACWAAGTTSDYNPITETLTDFSSANLTRAVIAGRASSGGGTYYNVKVNPSGSLTTAIGDITGIVGQTTMANSLPVTIASNQTGVPVTDNGGSLTVDGSVAATQSGTWNITNISGTVSLPTGAATEITLATLNTKVTACNTGAVTISAALPAGTNNIGDVDVLTLPSVTLASQANPFSTAIPVSDNGGSITVDGTVAATQSGTWSVATATYSSSAVSSVTSAATNTVLLASNASRRQAVLYNDCDKAVYVKLGATASSTSFSYRLQPNQTLELPTPVYTGAIDGIWDSSPTGSMRVTEIT